MMRITVLLLSGALLLSTAVTRAHHRLSDYRDGASLMIRGTVAEFLMRNPHSIVYVDVHPEKGMTERWAVEWVAELQLKRQGVTKGTLKPGDPLVITGLPAKNPENHRLWLRTITRSTDGWKWTGTFE
jgi:hypothetical protein